jgi:hypothetical protein
MWRCPSLTATCRPCFPSDERPELETATDVAVFLVEFDSHERLWYTLSYEYMFMCQEK